MACFSHIVRYLISLVAFVTLTTCAPSNILMVFNEPGTSHFYDATAIAEVLSNRGHNITFLLPIGSGKSVSKYKDKFQFITLDDRCRVQRTIKFDTVRQAQDMTIQSSTFSMETVKLPINLMIGYIHSLATGTEDYLCDVAVTDLLKSKFDLVIIEGSYLWIHGLLNRFNVPYALLTTCAPSPLTNSWNHAPNLPSVLPGFMAHTNHRKPMSFYWRLYSAFSLSASQVFFTTIADGTMVTAASAYVADVVVPPTVSFSRSDLWLTNADYATDVPRPYLPNTVMVGGLSIEEAKPLTQEFQTIADGANTHGLLVVSMGTVVTGVSQQQTDAMATAFARLPQTVIWKTPIPRPTFIGNNTLLRSWIPQKGLLAHPNTRALVYHCGNNGAFEALYHGIPIIAIPIFADQFDVAYRVMSNGMGKVVGLSILTDETLFEAVSEVINKPQYKDRAAFLSTVYRDNSDPAPERAAFWVEYILRHSGNKLMRSKVAFMGFCEEYLLDVWAFCSISLFIIFLIAKRTFSLLFSLVYK